MVLYVMGMEHISLRNPAVISLLTMVVGFIVVVLLAGYIAYLGYTTDYVNVYPLNRGRNILLPFKYETIVAIYDLKSNIYDPSSIVIVNGLTPYIGLARSNTSYAITYSSGVDVYVVIISIVSVIAYVLGCIRLHSLPPNIARIAYNIVLIVIVMLVISSSILYMNYNTILTSSITEDSIDTPLRIKLSKPTKTINTTLTIGGRVFNGTILVYNLDRVKDNSLVYLRSDRTILLIALMYRVDGEAKSEILDGFVNKYVGYIDLPDDVEEANLVLMYDTSGYNTSLTYMRISFIEIEKPAPYLVIAPGVALLVLVIIISILPSIHGRMRKTRSTPPPPPRGTG